jgi:hypothetical protein
MKTYFSVTLRTSVLLAAFVLPFTAQRAVCLQVSTSASPPSIANMQDEPTDSNQDADSADPSDASSKVRIVRLSEVTGEVDVYRQTGSGYEPALLNLPITEGTELRTGKGFAEVEFEDSSLLHLTPDTIVEFPRLESSPSGSKITTVEVEKGAVYVNLASTPGNQFMLTFAHQTARLTPSSHVRLLLTPRWASLSVLHGEVNVETPTGQMAEAKNKTVNFAFLMPTEITLNSNADGPYDDWDKSAIDYHRRFAKANAYGTQANMYGTNDLHYYGKFVNEPTCGVLWRPYFAGATWDPFANGSWVLYPNWGYTWVSPYPWGWTPYHYGSWEYCPSYGWGWRPFGVWRGIANVPRYGPRTVKPRYGPRLPPRPPHPGGPTVVTVNRQPPIRSGVNAGNRFMARENSAGLGIPRATLGNLNHLSGRLEQHGSDAIAVKSAPVVADNVRGSHQEYVPSYGRAGDIRGRESGYSGGTYSGGSSRASYSNGGGSRSSTSYASSGLSGGHSFGGSGSGSSGRGGGGGGGGGGGRR